MATLVFFHAHPDDEAIACGGTMARAAAEGHRVVLVTATRGEEGEVLEGVLAPDEALADRRTAETLAAAEALGVAQEGSFVYVVEDDTLARKPVTLGITVEGWVEVTAGLDEGAQVVVSGHTNLRPGARVRVSGGELRDSGSAAP